ncbi:hypothetical protein [Methylovulum psychrotolerans]|uniref:Uncharacterized protein n=1 Tax=Methylovulum psychrotolerans TaxID=1704499 RepID=A0A1Z4C4M6_9GAMM|nr:hypothetical protein [Methylovulum psychrotolerans]ASF48483.1 hypothetical protein CEK71_21830 [Methylovulum psychrotolerans]
MDFVVLHELSHIIRGHLDYYLKLSHAGLFEVDEEKEVLPNLRRLALELDADSVALYTLIGLSEFLLTKSSLYGSIKDMAHFVVTVGLASKILFGILGEASLAGKYANSGKTLANYHSNLQHPHPSVREEFAHQRLAQLANNEKEKLMFQASMEKSYGLFLAMVNDNLFPLISMESWLHSAEELADFLNVLIDEIGVASEEGWINDNTRISMSLGIVQGLQVGNTKRLPVN